MRFMNKLSILILSLSFVFNVSAAELELIVGPYLQQATKTNITILWETNQPANSVVEYGPALLRQQSKSLPERMVDNSFAMMHEIKLTGLTEQTDYFYRIVSKDAQGQEVRSELYSFQTAVKDDAAFAFAIFSDTQHNAGTRHVWGTISDLGWAERPNFALNAGDLVEHGDQQDMWRYDYLKPATKLMRRIPIYSVFGNHDGDSKYYYQYMANPAPEYYYTFTYGNAQFFMIDSNRDLHPDSEQYSWLERELAKSTAVWKFAVHHHPMYSSDENDYGDTNYEASLRADPSVQPVKTLYERYNMDMVFNGHIHQYERTWPLRNETIQENGVRYVVCGGAGGGLEKLAKTRSWFSAKVRSAHHFIMINIHEGNLQFQAIDEKGILFDQLTLQKNKNGLIVENRAPSAPLLRPAGGSFVDKTGIILESMGNDTDIRYTIDGSEPTVKSALYKKPLSISNNTQLKARCFSAKGIGSNVTMAEYNKVKPLKAIKVKKLQPEIGFNYYEGNWINLPDFENLKPVKSGTASDFDLESIQPRDDHFAILYEGYIDIRRDGVYKFFLTSDDGSRLFVAEQLIIDNDGSHSPISKHGEIALESGKHAFKLQYFEDYGGEALILKYTGPGTDRQKIAAERLYHN